MRHRSGNFRCYSGVDISPHSEVFVSAFSASDSVGLGTICIGAVWSFGILSWGIGSRTRCWGRNMRTWYLPVCYVLLRYDKIR
jgi:hypothetical protein